MSQAGDIWMEAYTQDGGEHPADLALTHAIMSGKVQVTDLNELADELWKRRWELKQSGHNPPTLKVLLND